MLALIAIHIPELSPYKNNESLTWKYKDEVL